MCSPVCTLLDNGKLTNQIARLVEIVVKNIKELLMHKEFPSLSFQLFFSGKLSSSDSKNKEIILKLVEEKVSRILNVRLTSLDDILLI